MDMIIVCGQKIKNWLIKKYLPTMPPVDSDSEVKEGKGLTILTQNKLLTRLQILLAQIKAGNNSYKLKNEIRQKLYLLCICVSTSLKKSN